MIRTREDLKYYIESDLKALGWWPLSIQDRIAALVCPSIWKYQVKLRKLEFYINSRRNNKAYSVLKALRRKNLDRYGCKLGYTIAPNCIGPGLCLCHRGTIVINEAVKIGSNARIHAGVNIGNYSKIGEEWSNDNVPVIGNNVYIGPGAKLFGKISIGDNVAIGANAVVNHDIPRHVTVAGVPAKIINYNGSEGMIIHGDENQ